MSFARSKQGLKIKAKISCMVLIKQAISLRAKVILEGLARLTGFLTLSQFIQIMCKQGLAMVSTSFKANSVRFKINSKTLTSSK
jgi:hypothetical protein